MSSISVNARLGVWDFPDSCCHLFCWDLRIASGTSVQQVCRASVDQVKKVMEILSLFLRLHQRCMSFSSCERAIAAVVCKVCELR